MGYEPCQIFNELHIKAVHCEGYEFPRNPTSS